MSSVGTSGDNSGSIQNFNTGSNAEVADKTMTTLVKQFTELTTQGQKENARGGDTKLKEQEGSVKFKDNIQSAKTEDVAGQQTEARALGATQLKSKPGTPEYEQEVLELAKTNFQNNHSNLLDNPSALKIVRDNLSVETRQAIDARVQQNGGAPGPEATDRVIEDYAEQTDAIRSKTVETASKGADTTLQDASSQAEDMQSKSVEGAYRQLIQDPSQKNLDAHPELSAKQKMILQDPILKDVFNALDNAGNALINVITGGKTREFFSRLGRADPKTPELASPGQESVKTSGLGAPPEASGGNRFFSVNLTVTLEVFFAKQQKSLTQMMLIEAQNKLVGLDRTMSIAESEADQILSSAAKQAMMYFIQAAMAAVSFVSSAGTLGFMAKARGDATTQVEADIAAKKKTAVDDQAYATKQKKLHDEGISSAQAEQKDIATKQAAGDTPELQQKMKKAKEKETHHQLEINKDQKKALDSDSAAKEAESNRFSSIENKSQQIFWKRVYVDQMVQAGTKMVENLSNAIITLQKAENEARLKMLEGYGKVNDQTLQSATKALNDIQEAIRTLTEAKERLIGALNKMTHVGIPG